MQYVTDRPLFVQNDLTIYLEAHHERYEEVREAIQPFAELLKSPTYIHTYRMTSLSLWNAASQGYHAERIITLLSAYAKFSLSYTVQCKIREIMDKFGVFHLTGSAPNKIFLGAKNEEYIKKLYNDQSFSSFFYGKIQEENTDGQNKRWKVQIVPSKRGELKQECLRLGFPVRDEAGYDQGDTLTFQWMDHLDHGTPFKLRPYQIKAAEAFHKPGSKHGGQGVLVLPCGAGKTIIGIECMNRLQCATLILTTNMTSVQQWKRELLEKTTLTEQDIGTYTGNHKEMKAVTIATYSILTYKDEGQFVHLNLFQGMNWGLVIYDEVHLLPAPIFRATAMIQSTRRLGLTATLVREDRKEEDVFSLIGPKLYEMSWKELEHSGHIAKAYCTEVRVAFDPFFKEQYYLSSPRKQVRIAQENPNKIPVIKELINKHQPLPTLIIGQYIDQLEHIGTLFHIPVITGQMKHGEREDLYHQFKTGQIPILAVSKVANFAVDLPDAAVAIQISGTYGSRQEEAQRIGRILRPKQAQNEAYFYHVVTKESKDQEYAAKRQMFLVEQGYQYQLLEVDG